MKRAPNRALLKHIKTSGLLLAVVAFCCVAVPAFAIDPPYQNKMERLTEVLGSLYFLQPLCGDTEENWRAQASDLISLDNPDEDRRQRLTGAFNTGYRAYARVYRTCTSSARAAIAKLLVEAEQTAREIHTKFAE